jgi:hypothetical protein
MYSQLSLKTPPNVGVSNEKWCNTAPGGAFKSSAVYTFSHLKCSKIT